MRARLISSIVLAPTALAVVVLGGWWLLAFFGVAMLLAAYEFFNLTRRGGYHPLRVPALLLIAGLFLDAHFDSHLAVLLIVLAIAIPPLWEMRPGYPRLPWAAVGAPAAATPRKPHDGFLLDWALTTLGVLYIGVLGAHMFYLGNVGASAPHGTINFPGFSLPLTVGSQLLGITLLATWLTDIFAYIAGRLWGRIPFFPDISPKKTREGAIGGIIAGTISFGLLGAVLGIPFALAVVGGLGIALVGTAGDLVESLLKRNIGVKDSGTLIAGHGGVLDRLDSMFFTLTFAYYYCTLVLGYG